MTQNLFEFTSSALLQFVNWNDVSQSFTLLLSPSAYSTLFEVWSKSLWILNEYFPLRNTLILFVDVTIDAIRRQGVHEKELCKLSHQSISLLSSILGRLEKFVLIDESCASQELINLAHDTDGLIFPEVLKKIKCPTEPCGNLMVCSFLTCFNQIR